VKKLLSFCTRICWRASRMASWKGMLSLERVVARPTDTVPGKCQGGATRI
jgi:hypothetical protein